MIARSAILVSMLLAACGAEVLCEGTATHATCGNGFAAGDFAICGTPRLLVERAGTGQPSCGIVADPAMCWGNGEPACIGGGEPRCFASPEVSAARCLDLMIECESAFGPGARCTWAVSEDGPSGNPDAL